MVASVDVVAANQYAGDRHAKPLVNSSATCNFNLSLHNNTTAIRRTTAMPRSHQGLDLCRNGTDISRLLSSTHTDLPSNYAARWLLGRLHELAG
jgi:hypothetical protein